MTDFILTIVAIFGAILTVWYIVVPAMVLVGGLTALGHGRGKELKQEVHNR